MPRIVHLGLGNFHRAHQAWYTAQGIWKITGVVMSNAQLHEELTAHDNRYALGIWGSSGLSTEIIDIYDDVFLVANDNGKIIDRIADTETQVVTLTITEKGYHLLPGSGHLNLSAQQIVDDMNTSEPNSALGLLALGLIRRRRTDAGPITVVSCDNLTANGPTLQQVVLEFLGKIDGDTVTWVMENVKFPATMVDRITPRLSDHAKHAIIQAVGFGTIPVVGAEAYTEWVIEDDFAGQRPDWEAAGAVYVANVSSFEERKLRLLNAAHSYLAFAGLLAGHEFVHEAISDPSLCAGVETLWDEAAVTVSAPACETLDAYRIALMDRFAVTDMPHRLSQIAEDGSLKLRERLVPSVKQRTAMGLDSPQTLKAIESWIRFVTRRVQSGAELVDPNDEEIVQIVKSQGDPQIRLAEFVGL